MITVGFDVSPLYSAHQVRGIGFYTQRLIRELGKIKGLKIKELKKKKEIFQADYDLLHLPYFHPYFFTLPWRKRKPLVITIHDLIPLKYPRHYPPGLKARLRWWLQKKRLAQVDLIITDSLASRADIVKLLGYPQEQIKVIYLAADRIFQPIKNKKQLEAVKKKYRLPPKFVLYVGDVNWNKNLPGLVKACAKIKIPLVIVGQQAVNKNIDRDHPENKDLVWLQNYYQAQPPQASQLFLLGFVPTEDLIALYNLATLYCQPSFDEGFGLPVIEAMACGCPVVSSRRGSLPEVVGSSGLLVEPEVEDLARGIEKLIQQPQLRKKYRRLGLEQAQKFSWSKTAQATAQAYFSLLDQNTPKSKTRR